MSRINEPKTEVFDILLTTQAQRHSSCLELCMSNALEPCPSSHTEASPVFSLVYSIYNSVSAAIATAPTEKQVHFSDQLEEFRKNVWVYVGHILKTKHQGDYYRWS